MSQRHNIVAKQQLGARRMFCSHKHVQRALHAWFSSTPPSGGKSLCTSCIAQELVSMLAEELQRRAQALADATASSAALQAQLAARCGLLRDPCALVLRCWR